MPKVQVQELSEQGDGIAFYQDKILYIPNALKGEVLEVEIGESFVKGSKRSPAKILNFIQKSKYRVEPFCPYFSQCGGCALQHLALKEQRQEKRLQIVKAFKESNLPQEKIKAFRDSPQVKVCRYKTIRSFCYDKEGNINVGFYKKRSHEVVEILECPQEDPLFAKFLRPFCDFLNANLELFPLYNEQDLSGNLRHILLRSGGSTQDLMAVLILAKPLNSKALDTLRAFVKNLKVKFFICLNDSVGNDILSSNILDISEKGPLQVELLNLKFNAYPTSFLQVNYPECERLYQKAIDFCAQGSKQQTKALDLCCGVGTITLALTKYFAEVIGVEIVESAIKAANENAKLNAIENVSFKLQDINEATSLIQDPKVKSIIADPSRRGLGERTVKALCKVDHPLRLALIFCSLKALKRDVPPLVSCGYKIEEVLGFDLFPNSMHLETLVLLSKDC